MNAPKILYIADDEDSALNERTVYIRHDVHTAELAALQERIKQLERERASLQDELVDEKVKCAEVATLKAENIELAKSIMDNWQRRALRTMIGCVFCDAPVSESQFIHLDSCITYRTEILLEAIPVASEKGE